MIIDACQYLGCIRSFENAVAHVFDPTAKNYSFGCASTLWFCLHKCFHSCMTHDHQASPKRSEGAGPVHPQISGMSSLSWIVILPNTLDSIIPESIIKQLIIIYQLFPLIIMVTFSVNLLIPLILNTPEMVP